MDGASWRVLLYEELGILVSVICRGTTQHCLGGFPIEVMAPENWRKRVGVEPTGDRIACHPPVLKTGTITGPHALPSTPRLRKYHDAGVWLGCRLTVRPVEEQSCSHS
jgi:hypothetical protein